MKIWNKLFLLMFLPIAAACADGEGILSDGEESSLLKLSFDLDGCGVVTGTLDTRTLTAVSTEALGTGVRFTVRAYKSEGGGFVDEGVYVIVDDATSGMRTTAVPLAESGKDNGLYLTRGEYDLRFLSYNLAAEHPVVNTGGKTTVSNGKDLIATSLKNVLVRADKDGQTDFSIPLKGHPFEHLCACVKAVFQIPEGQVVIPTAVSAMNIVLKNLCKDATYDWSTGVLTPSATREATATVALFSSSSIGSVPSTPPIIGSKVLAEAVSGDAYVLPLDESVPLKFDISMKIKFNSTQAAGTEKENTLTIDNLENVKALLPGKAYGFIFSLSFYGDYLPADLILAVQDYVPVELNPDDVGGDNL